MQNYCIVQFLGGLNLLRRSSRKISLSMKLLFILIVCSFGLAYASDGYAQKTSITLKANDCTIEEVLHKIELESGFGFFVNSKNLDLKRKVSVSVSNKNIFQVLEQVFKGVAQIQNSGFMPLSELLGVSQISYQAADYHFVIF